MDSLASIVGKNMESKGLGESSFAAMLVARSNKHIADFLGNIATKNIVVKTFERNIIGLEITSSAWAQEFQFCRTEFLNRIRKDFPDKTILDVKIRIIGREDMYDIVEKKFKR